VLVVVLLVDALVLVVLLLVALVIAPGVCVRRAMSFMLSVGHSAELLIRACASAWSMRATAAEMSRFSRSVCSTRAVNSLEPNCAAKSRAAAIGGAGCGDFAARNAGGVSTITSGLSQSRVHAERLTAESSAEAIDAQVASRGFADTVGKSAFCMAPLSGESAALTGVK
jgi:hypothetical protein